MDLKPKYVVISFALFLAGMVGLFWVSAWHSKQVTEVTAMYVKGSQPLPEETTDEPVQEEGYVSQEELEAGQRKAEDIFSLALAGELWDYIFVIHTENGVIRIDYDGEATFEGEFTAPAMEFWLGISAAFPEFKRGVCGKEL